MYRYRVRLVLSNPNYKAESRYLAHPESAKSRSIESPWSEPTGVIVVPPDIRILARAVTLSHQGEPEGKVMVMKWIEDSGITAYQEFPNKDNRSPIVRGQNLDFTCIVRPPQKTVLDPHTPRFTKTTSQPAPLPWTLPGRWPCRRNPRAGPERQAGGP